MKHVKHISTLKVIEHVRGVDGEIHIAKGSLKLRCKTPILLNHHLFCVLEGDVNNVLEPPFDHLSRTLQLLLLFSDHCQELVNRLIEIGTYLFSNS